MSFTSRFVGVAVVGLCAACGEGPGDDANDNRIQNPLHRGLTDRGDTYGASGTGTNPIYNNPLFHGSATVQTREGINPLYKGSVAQDDGNLSERYEYLLHGSDADLDGWLNETDIVMERSTAGDLTYARVLTTGLRDVPASLKP